MGLRKVVNLEIVHGDGAVVVIKIEVCSFQVPVFQAEARIPLAL